MVMIHTIKPYGYLNISEITHIIKKGDRFYALDKYGIWQINESDYNNLSGMGIKEYVRKNI